MNQNYEKEINERLTRLQEKSFENFEIKNLKYLRQEPTPKLQNFDCRSTIYAHIMLVVDPYINKYRFNHIETARCLSTVFDTSLDASTEVESTALANLPKNPYTTASRKPTYMKIAETLAFFDRLKLPRIELGEKIVDFSTDSKFPLK